MTEPPARAARPSTLLAGTASIALAEPFAPPPFPSAPPGSVAPMAVGVASPDTGVRFGQASMPAPILAAPSAVPAMPVPTPAGLATIVTGPTAVAPRWPTSTPAPVIAEPEPVAVNPAQAASPLSPAPPVTMPPVPPPATIPPATIRPALQAFGAALHRAAAAERRPAATMGDPLFTPVSFAPVVTAPVATAAPLDTTQPRWPDAMMTRIEQIRDAQNAGDTRIRLHPDALGPVDVAIRHEGETVHVHLAAADPATVRLLADAQPRLLELAEAKGLKLAASPGDGSAANTGGANSGTSDGERRQPAPPAPTTGRPVPARQADPEDHTDTRLA